MIVNNHSDNKITLFEKVFFVISGNIRLMNLCK